MIIHYINLDEATSRREAVEASFAAACPAHLPCELIRFPAISAQDIRVNKILSTRSNREKACILSHYDVLLKACESEDYNWIVEDDVCFSPTAFEAVNDFIERFKEADWDLLFTEVDIRVASHMVDFFRVKETLAEGEISSMNLLYYPFGSAASYIINPRRREKVKAALPIFEMPADIDYLWDLLLSECITHSKLTAFVTLPFVTELSEHAQSSQIQTKEGEVTNLLFQAFRKLMHVSADTDNIKKMLNKIDDSYFDDKSYCLGKIISGFTTKTLVVK